MQVLEKALYNLLRFNWLKDPTLKVAPWQVEDYRSYEQSALLQRLGDLGLSLDEDRFLASAEEVRSPEELIDALWKGEGEEKERAYLLIFELWRRLLPHRESLSVFCDDLDHQIHLYDEHQKLEEIDELLVRLEDILDSYDDAGENPKKAFRIVSSSCTYNLERFLFEYIMDLIDAGEQLTASELIDGFYEYVTDTKRFEFLRIRLFADVDPQETALHLTRLVESLKDASHIDLLMEIASFLVSFGQDSLYRTVIAKGLEWLKTEGEFVEILENIRNYFSCLDQDAKAFLIKEVLTKRRHHESKTPVDPTDSDIESIKHVLLS